MSNTQPQLTLANDYNPKNLFFQDPVAGSVADSKVPTYRIQIKYKYPSKNGRQSYGDLIIPTETLFSFGVQENEMNGKCIGYSLPLCMYNREGATDAEKQWVSVFEQIVEQCKEHVIANRQAFPGKYDLELRDLKKFSASSLYRKRNPTTGEIDPSVGPTLYPKLIMSKKDGKEVVKSLFYDADTGEELNPMSMKGKYCHATSSIKIESIFVGSTISIQIKLWETELSLLDKGIQRLLRPTTTRVEEKQDYANEDEDEENYSEHEDTFITSPLGSIEHSEEEPEVVVAVKPKRRVGRK